MFELGVFLGVMTGLGLSLWITVFALKRSNDVGDSKGQLLDFGRLNILHKSTRLSSRGYDKDVAKTMSLQMLDMSYRGAIEKAEREQQIEDEMRRHATQPDVK